MNGGGRARSSVERTMTKFNRYIYQNLVSQLEVQIENWNRMANAETNLQAAQALRLKAEGLGYGLRLLDAFEPEFQELVDCANQMTRTGGTHYDQGTH